MILIVANGELQGTDGGVWLRALCGEADMVIAADGGLGHLLAVGCWPTVIIGDMDSLPQGSLEAADRPPLDVVAHPPAKDETDLELALHYAVANRPDDRKLRVAGALGGRLDQLLANVFLLAHPRLTAHDVRLVEYGLEAWLVRDRAEVIGEVGDIVSLLPIGGPVLIASTTGLAWPLHMETLAFGPARGVSNRLTAEVATVVVARGLALCVHMVAGWPTGPALAEEA